MDKETAMIPYEQVVKMSEVIVKSGLFGVQRPEQALALMLVAQAEGLHPITAARDYHIIQGRPTLKSDSMLARFVQCGGKITWKEYNDQRVSATFSHPDSGEIFVDWDMERAKRAGLANRDIWKAYPRNMMRARVISEGVRAIAPWVAIGVITKEEAEDIPVAPPLPQPQGARVDAVAKVVSETDVAAVAATQTATLPAGPDKPRRGRPKKTEQPAETGPSDTSATPQNPEPPQPDTQAPVDPAPVDPAPVEPAAPPLPAPSSVPNIDLFD